MNSVRQWAFSLCAAGVVSAIIQTISPKAALSKLMQTVTSLFMLLCILVPISKLVPLSTDLAKRFTKSESSVGSSSSGELYQKIVLENAKLELEELIRDKLRKMSINPVSVRINITMSEDEIAIGDVDLVLPYSSRSNHDNIRSQLENELGLTVKIGYQ